VIINFKLHSFGIPRSIKIFQLSCLAALLVLLSLPACAEENVFQLSLEELLQVKIASLKPESVLQAPAIIARYDADILRRWGLRSLPEMLNFIPNLVTQDITHGANIVMIRGISGFFSQKVLFMLDGVPYWQPAHGGAPIHGIPVELIDHIEVIRGPGSVIYGTNASAGVINIVTQKSSQAEFSITLGENGHQQLQGYRQAISDSGWQFDIGVEWQQQDGYQGLFTNRPVPSSYPADTPITGRINKQTNKRSLYIAFEKNKLQGFVHSYQAETNGLAGAASLINEVNLWYKGNLLHVNYDWIMQDWNMSIFTDYNQHILEIPTQNFFNGVGDALQRFENGFEDNFRWRTGLHLNYQHSTEINWLNGVEYERRETGNFELHDLAVNQVVHNLLGQDSLDEISLFSQIDYRQAPWTIVVGARYTDNSKSGDQITPRVSMVYSIDDSRSLKMLYSTGFNSPNFNQLGIDVPPQIVAGNPNLKAETLTSFDLGYSHKGKDYNWGINLFEMKLDDGIIRVPNPSGTGVMFQNRDSFTRSGLEIEGQKITNDWMLSGNLSYLRQGNEIDVQDLTALFAPKWSMALGGHYRLDDSHQFGFSYNHISARSTADAVRLLNLNYQYQRTDWSLELTLTNLLKDDYLHADVQDSVADRLVQGGDDSVGAYLTLSYRW